MKKCSVCEIDKELSEFHKMKNSKDGYRGQCKLCRIKITKEYRKINKNSLTQKAKEYVSKNKEICAIAKKKWKEKNRKAINEKHRIYRKKYYQKKGDEVRKNQQKYREDNKDKIKEWNRIYYEKIKHIKAWRRLISDTLFRLGKQKEGHTIDLLGYSAIELKNHITSLFTEGMSWDNYGQWHIDHVKPVSKFDKETSMNVVNALSNLQPLWATTREINGIIYEGNLNKHAKV
jgi:hypothetical protein